MIEELERIGLAHIRAAIGGLLAKTEAARHHAPGGFVGGVSWRRALDNEAAGRLHLRIAHEEAAAALALLDGGEPWRAAARLRSVESFYVAALEMALARAETKRGDPALEFLVLGAAEPRGRRPGKTLERDRRLAEAIGPEYSVAAARVAVEADPVLEKAFRGMRDRTLWNAYARGSKKVRPSPGKEIGDRFLGS